MGQSPTDFNLHSATALPSFADIATAVKTSVQVGVDAINSHPDVSGHPQATSIVKTGWEAFAASIEAELASLAERAASAVGGPIAGEVAAIAIPQAIPILTEAINSLFAHIKADIPQSFRDFASKL